MLTAPDLKALAAYLRETAAFHTSRQNFLVSEEHPTSAKIHEAKAEQLNHWAAGVEEIVQTRALDALDLPPAPAGIEGLHDGLVHVFPAAPSASPATFSPNS